MVAQYRIVWEASMVKLIKSTFYNELETKKALSQFITESSVLSMGEECSKFEKSFSAWHSRKHSVFVSNGSAANLLLIQALLNLGRLKKGDKVGVSAVTWPTNVMPLIQLGLEPVAIDCELNTLNISPRTVEKVIGSLKAIFLTNVLGFSDNILKIKEMCERAGVLLLEDNCESLGTKAYGQLLGNFGLASTFSFYVGHHFSTIEGGMICTDDLELAEAMTMGRAHGWDRNLSAEKQIQLRDQHKIDSFFSKFTFYDLAYNVRPSEINGYAGNFQLKYLNEIIEIRQKNYFRFAKAAQNNNAIYQYDFSHLNVISNFAFPLVFKNYDSFLRARNKFSEAHVEIRPVIAGDMTQQPFWKKYVKQSSDCPNSSIVHKNGLYLPNNPDLTESEISLLTQLISEVN